MQNERSSVKDQPLKDRNRYWPFSGCDDCLRPFQVIESIRTAVGSGVVKGADKVLDEAARKLKLFMEQTLMCFVQWEALQESWDVMDVA